ncbi:MAG TPA: hypothetical protein DEF61_04930 [Firmicutes bacterium]|nr:hypothetical protein [Bacillota bacterium]HBX25571.1 hypothetical protein [Bacillota bacterium]
MIVFKSLVTQKKDLKFNETFTFDKDELKNYYPLVEVKKALMDGYFYRDEEDYLRCNLIIKANVTLIDSITNEPFDKEMEIKDDFEIMDKEDGEGEGYIFSSSSFSLSSLCLCLIKSSIPLKVRKED